MTSLTGRSVQRRFLVLTASRWLSTGLLFPVIVLLPLERGMALSELGIAFAVQGVVVLALELPTGGIADAIGRKRVLLVATVVSLVSIGLFLVADSFAAFAAVFALQGVYRALESGPLQAWYVDAALAVDPHARIEKGLSGAGVVVGLAIAGGSLAGGGLIALDPIPAVSALSVPVVVSLALGVVDLAGIAVLMVEQRPTSGLRAAARGVGHAPQAIRDGFRLLRRSRVLAAVVAVELFWGFAMVTFESLTPVRLAEIVGNVDDAAAITGPAGTGAWLAAAAGAAAVPWLGRRIGIAPTAAMLRVLQGVTVVGIGLFAGVIGVIVAYLACYTIHGASNPAHMTLLHRQVEGPVRATVVSLNSMAALPAGAVGAVTLTALAEGTSTSTAMYVGAAVLAVAAPLYIPAWRQERKSDELSQRVPAGVAHQSCG